jgi:hypothetical protein
VFYTRLIRLEHSGSANGRLIATYEHYPSPFIVYQSDDDGLTWHRIATAPRGEMPAPWTFEGEPHLYELPAKTGDLPAGTILLAGSAVRTHPDGKHLMQRLEVYASTDHGLSWKYRGVADTADGVHGSIWEPNVILAANGNLVMYFSDERLAPTYSQVLALRESSDGGISWKAEKNIVAVPDGKQRPGMAVVQRLPNGKFVMSYEWVNGEENPAYIRFSDDGVNWGETALRGIPVKTASGESLGGTPYCIWTPFGGPEGTLVVNARQLTHSSNTDREVFINTHMGEGPWVAMPSPVQWQGNQEFDGWSMGMIPTADQKGIILMASSYSGNDENEVIVGRSPLLIPGLEYTLQNAKTGAALSIPGTSTQHGTLLQTLPLDGGTGQTWRLTDLGSEKFGLINPASGLAVDDYEMKVRNGSPLAVWDSNELPFQQWRPIPTGLGDFKLLNVNANRLLSVANGSSSVVLWDNDDSHENRWRIVRGG